MSWQNTNIENDDTKVPFLVQIIYLFWIKFLSDQLDFECTNQINSLFLFNFKTDSS